MHLFLILNILELFQLLRASSLAGGGVTLPGGLSQTIKHRFFLSSPPIILILFLICISALLPSAVDRSENSDIGPNSDLSPKWSDFGPNNGSKSDFYFLEGGTLPCSLVFGEDFAFLHVCQPALHV